MLATRGDSPEARQALSDLCAAYYTPVFVLIRRATPSEEAARDLTQEFFARLLSRIGGLFFRQGLRNCVTSACGCLIYRQV